MGFPAVPAGDEHPVVEVVPREEEPDEALIESLPCLSTLLRPPPEPAQFKKMFLAGLNRIEGKGEDTTQEEQEDEENMNYAEMGAATDSGEEDHEAELVAAAEEQELDPEAYETWASLGEALDEGSEEEEPEEEEEEEEEEQTYAEVGAQIDAGEAEEDELTDLLTEADLDPDDYETWEAAGAALDEVAEGEEEEEEPEEEEEEEPEEEEEDDDVIPEKSWAELGEQIDEGDDTWEPQLTAAAEEADLDPDDYETWAELGAAMDEAGGEEEEEGDPDNEEVEGEVVDDCEVGDTIQWEYEGETLYGEVTELLPNGVRAEREDNGKNTFIDYGDYELYEGEE